MSIKTFTRKKAGSSFKEINLERDKRQALYLLPSWRKYSRQFLAANPRCIACGEKSQAVDHMRPHRGDLGRFKDPQNHIPLCTVCHNTVTSRFDRRGGSLEEKVDWIAKKRSEKKLSPVGLVVKIPPNFLQIGEELQNESTQSQ